jgi:hypothetical protein
MKRKHPRTMPTKQISVFNQSKRITLADLTTMISCLDIQHRRDFCPAWGRAPWAIVQASDPNPANLPAGALPLYILDNPDVANAGGYHDVDPHGNAYIKAFVDPYLDNGGTVLSTPDSVLSAASHEVNEAREDEDCSEWALMPDGRLVARETSDPCEGDGYLITAPDGRKGMVSNFLLPDWFVAQKENEPGAQFDYLAKLKAPFTMDAGGYWIVMKNGRVTSEFAAHFPKWKRELKAIRSSRFCKRNAIVDQETIGYFVGS